MKKPNLIIYGFVHSLGVLIYISLLAWFLFNGEQFFGQKKTFLIPVAMLMLLVLSAAITGALVLGKPILLYLDNQKSDALKLFFYTIGWLAIMAILLFGSLAITK